MDPSGFLIGLVVLLFVIGVPALAIAAYGRAGAIKKKTDEELPPLISRIYGLEQRLGQLEKALAALGGSSAAAEKAPLQPAPVAEVRPPAVVVPAVVPPLQSQTPSSPAGGVPVHGAVETSKARPEIGRAHV
jgi:hypothetical protein